ncbi:MAG TPA: sulfurtransferase [Streptosporangiaceae bacterium]|nr:sulfurtransferase [Streptosporangiaceae bacterium]
MSPLIAAAALAGELAGAEPPTLIDARWRLGGPPGIDSYRAGHLPGAVYVDLDRDLSGPPGQAGRHPLPEAGGFQATMRRAGVRDGHPVVVYDDGGTLAAARAWWLLRYFGHDQVRVLDGGFRAWQAAGQPLTEAEPSPPPGDFTARPGHMPLIDADGASATARTGLLLDVRAPERYRGDSEPIDPVGGHIPGAVNAPFTGSLTGEGTFRDPAELRERFAALGAAPGGPVAAYCGSGVTAAQEVLALELAGIPAALYIGSWSNWLAEPGRPVATGPEPG